MYVRARSEPCSAGELDAGRRDVLDPGVTPDGGGDVSIVIELRVVLADGRRLGSGLQTEQYRGLVQALGLSFTDVHRGELERSNVVSLIAAGHTERTRAAHGPRVDTT